MDFAAHAPNSPMCATAVELAYEVIMIETTPFASPLDASPAPSQPSSCAPDSHAANVPASAHLGIDVSKKKLDAALLRLGKIKSKEVPNTRLGFEQLRAWLVAQGVKLDHQALHICMESTGPYSEACAQWLTDAGFRVSIVNPMRIKGFGQSELSRNKTDTADAALIARFCAAQMPSTWQAPSVAVRLLRGWVERLAGLVDMRRQELNRLEATSEALGDVVKARKAVIKYLDKAVDKQERLIQSHIAKNPHLSAQSELLQSIPGIAHVTAAKVLAYAGDIGRFASAGAFAAFIGVTPQQRSSGMFTGRTRMAKRGLGALRSALYMPATVAKRYNPVVAALSARLTAKGMAPKAIVGAAMHKLAHLIYGVLKSGSPFRANWACERGTPGAVNVAAGVAAEVAAPAVVA